MSLSSRLKNKAILINSVTISDYSFGEDAATPKELFEHADQALYETKP